MLSLNESCEITQLNTYNTLFSEMRLFFFLSFLRSCELRSPPEVFKVSLICQLRSQASQMLMVFQVYSFGLPEKVGTGQDGPDFLQWNGWEGGIMPKQVLFCLYLRSITTSVSTDDKQGLPCFLVCAEHESTC